MTLRGRSQDTNKGHIGRPVLPMSPGSGGGSTTSIKWEEPRDCTWPYVSPPDAREVECISFYQLLWGARGPDTAELCQALGQGDRGHRQGGSVSAMPSGFSSS